MKEGWQDLDYLPISEAIKSAVSAAHEEVTKAEIELNKARRRARLAQVSSEITVEVVTKKHGVFKCGISIGSSEGEIVYNTEEFETFSEVSGFSSSSKLDKALVNEIRAQISKALKIDSNSTTESKLKLVRESAQESSREPDKKTTPKKG